MINSRISSYLSPSIPDLFSPSPSLPLLMPSPSRNYKVRPSQEMIAMGVANVVSSFFSSIPVTGSFSRTAVNYQTGVKTPFGGVFTGGIVLLALGLLAPMFKYIPKAALAAVIISRCVLVTSSWSSS